MLAVKCEALFPDGEVQWKGGTAPRLGAIYPTKKFNDPEVTLSTTVGWITDPSLAPPSTCVFCQVALQSLPLEAECISPPPDVG